MSGAGRRFSTWSHAPAPPAVVRDLGIGIAATALAHDIVLVTRDERLAALPLIRARLAA